MTVQSKCRVAVLGASGYAGAELVRLLARHPGVEISLLGAASEAGKELRELYPALRGLRLPALAKLEARDLAGKADLVFLALPHTESQKMVPALLAAGLKVVDLSGDFRLRDAAQYA
ncbi:MAG TPA: N-acetyl-gamma-glutamyl-phosphate reductase, partial [bacterium]|nr:N-acetyl-gamma-glutamyl-phosphate reductase [bacterium]